MALHTPSNSKLWTFEAAVSLVRETADASVVESLESFITTNRNVLGPAPFAASRAKLGKSTEVTVRGVTYGPITPTVASDAEIIASRLGVDETEVARVIVQAQLREAGKEGVDALLRKEEVTDDNKGTTLKKAFSKDVHAEAAARVNHYQAKVHHEINLVVELTTLLVRRKTNAQTSLALQSVGKDLFATPDLITQTITQLKALTALTKAMSTITTINYTLRLLIELVSGNPNILPSDTAAWFDLMEHQNLSPLLCEAPRSGLEGASLLSSGVTTTYPEETAHLATLLSLLFLDLDGSLEPTPSSYANHPETLVKINTSLINNPTNPIVMLAWTVVLYRQGGLAQQTGRTIIEDLEHTLKAFLTLCDRLDVHASLRACYKSVCHDQYFISVLASLVINVAPYTFLTPALALTIETIMAGASTLLQFRFFSDPDVQRWLITARAKFPSDILLFIRLASLNAEFAYAELRLVRSYAAVLSREMMEPLYEYGNAGFVESAPEQGDAEAGELPGAGGADLVTLTGPIELSPMYEQGGVLLIMEAGTKATLIPLDDDEVLVAFLYRFNGWSLLGRVLFNASQCLDADSVEFIMAMFRLLHSVVGGLVPAQVEDVLASMAETIEDGDILEVIFRVVERSGHGSHSEVMLAGLDLLSVLVRHRSSRVWLFLLKSNLLGGEQLLEVTLAAEVSGGKFDVTIASFRLMEALLGDCLCLGESFPAHQKGEILLLYTTHSLRVFESFVYWSMTPSQKGELGTLLVGIYSQLLTSVYSVTLEGGSNPMEVYVPSTKLLVETFLVSDLGVTPSTLPLLSTIELALGLTPDARVAGTCEVEYHTPAVVSASWSPWIIQSITFSTLLISVRSLLNLQPPPFEASLFSQSPLLVKIYAQNLPYKLAILRLITTMLNSPWPLKPPSLLSHLGTHHTRILATSLSIDLKSNFTSTASIISIYDFFAAVMKGGQQGLALTLTQGDPTGDSLLCLLKKNIGKIHQNYDSTSLHLIDALALAFNSWATIKDSPDDASFIGHVIQYLQTVSEEAPQTTTDMIQSCYKLKMVSKLSEILALYLYSGQTTTCDLILDFIKSPPFLAKMMGNFKISGYDSVSHKHLEAKFAALWGPLRLKSFTRSGLTLHHRFGSDSVYDLNLLDSFLRGQPEWETFQVEIATRSIEFQRVVAQLNTSKSLGALVTAFCQRSGGSLDPLFLTVAVELLKINAFEGPPDAIISEVYQERIELAFFIGYNSSRSSKRPSDTQVYALIASAARLLVSPEYGFIERLDGNNGSYRSLLRLLVVSFGMLQGGGSLGEHDGTLKDIFGVFSKGLSILLSSIQNEVWSKDTSTTVKPEATKDSLLSAKQVTTLQGVHNEFSTSTTMTSKLQDLVLLMGILKAFVSLRPSSDLQNTVTSLLLNDGTLRAVMNLYSSSHLILMNGEPVFAELMLMIIYQLVSVGSIAELLITIGLFTVLTESPILHALQAGVRPTQTPRHHHLWSGELLPIILVLLGKFGAKVLPEVCVFLSLFSKQIYSTLYGWAVNSVVISLPLIHETAQLVLLEQVLEALNVGEYLQASKLNHHPVLFPGLASKDDRLALADRLKYLLSHPKFLTSRVAPCTLEQQRLFDIGGKGLETFIAEVNSEIRQLRESLL